MKDLKRLPGRSESNVVMNGSIKGVQGSVFQTHRVVCAGLGGNEEGQGHCTESWEGVRPWYGCGPSQGPRAEVFAVVLGLGWGQ